MPNSGPLLEQIESRLLRLKSLAEPFAGIVYRSSTPKYATLEDLLSGEGSKREGGRWNPARYRGCLCCLEAGSRNGRDFGA